MNTLEGELDRIWDALATQPQPPYWIAVGAVERRSVEVEATHGAAGPIHIDSSRGGDVDLRVGSFELDNTHKIRDQSWFSEEGRPELTFPVADDHPRAIQNALWRAAEESYRSALRRLMKVQTNEAVKVERTDASADFSAAEVIVDLQEIVPVEVDGEAWQEAVRTASDVFLDYPNIFDSNVSFKAHDETHYLLTTEGTRVRHQRVHLRVGVWASTVAPDGQTIKVFDYIDARSTQGMPSQDEVVALAHSVANTARDLRAAPIFDPYVGPVLLRGRAAAVFFHEVLGHRAEGHRQKDEDEGQTFTDKVGESILPDFLSVTDDPTRMTWGEVDLNGYYPYDDEGVPSSAVNIVRDGVLVGFLQSRSPIEGFEVSNGHGRRQVGSAVVARQGNLIVESAKALPYAELRNRLLAQIKAQGKPFGLIVDDISGGFTYTGRVTPNAFNVRAVTAWKVFADGTPDELVRGVDLIGTPLTTFSRVLATSDQYAVFNGACGAESGWVPVSAVAPDILVETIEVQRKEKGHDRPPLLEPPGRTL